VTPSMLPHRMTRSNDRSLATFLDDATRLGGVDLHLHSCFSDGKPTPATLAEQACRHRLRVFALTDHDTVDGNARVRAALERAGARVLPWTDGPAEDGIVFIPGVECSTSDTFDGTAVEIHILGYFTEDAPPRMDAYLARQRARRETRNRAMLQKMSDHFGVEVTFEDLARFAGKGAVLGRNHMALWLVDRGHCATTQEAFDTFLKPGRPFYVPRTRERVEAACDAIGEAGGVAVLAHPNEYKGWVDDLSASGRARLRERFERMRAYGIRGIECFHGMATPAQSRAMVKLARDLGLIVTAGSDSHGRPNDAVHAAMYTRERAFTEN
jgi:predicted metal-dependent phosphoesterase TrpH